ncbi:MAG TPA: alpha-1,4-glucan--maltose-1-phosphate maltosyltransferase [Acidimicrobiales bacterium]|nr:alpha-1,4-glucan--maltose-1-phosphate maltosyltransferase [Acidimicrobiales bacterium]
MATRTPSLGAIVIDQLRPATPGGSGRPKSSVGERTPVQARIFRDGHDLLAARVSWRKAGGRKWIRSPLAQSVNDIWVGEVECTDIGAHEVLVEAWTDVFATWRKELRLKVGADQDVTTELEEGARILEAFVPECSGKGRSRVEEAIVAIRDDSATMDVRLNAALDDALVPLVAGIPHAGDLTAAEPISLWVDRERARHSAWYEFFPRSEGGFKGSLERLDAVAEMGFDVVYFPPIHPIGTTARKGPNNTLAPGPDDVGSPWAIGGPEGGHTSIHPDLGSEEELLAVVEKAKDLGMEIALDYALQCSPDHPWVQEHPEWFHHRPDGTIKYAENPPKKYQDIYPINFWPDDDGDRKALWEACKGILDHWIAEGIRIFRVDNPHTKPMAFWARVIPAVQAEHPDVLFLAEAFTRPKVMAKLAEVGFSQSYTYFTWRTTKSELAAYLTELTTGPTADYMRPNVWPNTPDILAHPLRDGSPAVFRMRLLLAATMVPSYGIYSGYELCENEWASEANEEYLSSEKYEIRERDWDREDSLAPFIAQVNRIRTEHPALQTLRNTIVHHSSNDALLAYSRHSDDLDDVILCVVNLDADSWQEDTLWIDLGRLGLPLDEPFEAHDLLTGDRYTWQGPNPYVRLDPAETPGHVLHLRAIRT